jgi:hypothetical protein
MRADEDDLSVLVNAPGVEEPFYVKEGQAQDYQLRRTNKEA